MGWLPKAVIGLDRKFRGRFEKSRIALFIAVPVIFGFGLGNYPAFWEEVERWHPSAASNPKGPYLPKELTEHRPSLQTEYNRLVLEQALDAALEDVRRKKAEAAAGKA